MKQAIKNRRQRPAGVAEGKMNIHSDPHPAKLDSATPSDVVPEDDFFAAPGKKRLRHEVSTLMTD